MTKLNWILMSLNFLIMILINILIQFGKVPRSDYDFGANAVVIVCILACAYTLKNMHTTKWFGSTVQGDHQANVTVSKIFGLLCLVPALFMNFHPFLRWIN